MPPSSSFSISAFYLICVPLRVSIAVWAWDDRELTRHQPPSTVAARRIPAVAAATAISASFFFLTTGRLKRDSGAETGRIWWKSLRPVHGALWGSFAALKALQLYNQPPGVQARKGEDRRGPGGDELGSAGRGRVYRSHVAVEQPGFCATKVDVS